MVGTTYTWNCLKNGAAYSGDCAPHTLARLIFFRKILLRTSWNWFVSGTRTKNSDKT